MTNTANDNADAPDPGIVKRLDDRAITGDAFEETVLQADSKVVALAFFWAPWCKPCLETAPAVLHAADAYGDRVLLATVNTDREEDLTRKQSVAGLPTVVLFKNGEALDRFVGRNTSALTGAIDTALGVD